jgi:hypothetical protein
MYSRHTGPFSKFQPQRRGARRHRHRAAAERRELALHPRNNALVGLTGAQVWPPADAHLLNTKRLCDSLLIRHMTSGRIVHTSTYDERVEVDRDPASPFTL